MPLQLHPDVASTNTDDGLVLLHQSTGSYWQLNATGAEVLRYLLDGQTSEQIAERLASQHKIDLERARHDVTAVLEQLHSAELIKDL